MSQRMYNRYRRLVELAAVMAPPLALIGCSSVPQSPILSQPDSTTSRPASQAKAGSLPVLPPAGSGRGGYYLDDGPGDAPPEGLLDTPDAEPRIEPYATTRTNKPYVVFGKTYSPFTDERPFKQRGIGSWYGKKFHGQKTSSGEPYDMYKMTAAHPTLPIPSYARVTNIVNGKQVIVRVNDRGPFHSGRIIDLSYTAALKLGYLGKGSGELEVERLLPEEIERIAKNKRDSKDSKTAAAQPAPSFTTPQPVSRAEAPSGVVTAAVNLGGTDVVQVFDLQQPNDKPVVVAAPPAMPAQGFYLQLGAYSQAANAEAARTRLAQGTAMTMPSLEVVEQGQVYRVYGGPFATRAEAAAVADQLRAGGIHKPMIVQR